MVEKIENYQVTVEISVAGRHIDDQDEAVAYVEDILELIDTHCQNVNVLE